MKILPRAFPKQLCYSLFLLWLIVTRGSAATITWTNTAGGLWSVAANWQPHQVPGAADTAVLSAAGTYVVTATGIISVNALTLGGAGASPTLRLQGAAATGNMTLTVANGFTNQGTIELMDLDVPRAVTLNVSNGALVNAAGATIQALAGKGGIRALAAELDNRGTLLVEQDLNINKAAADHTNSGTIKLSGADLTVPQSGASPSFTQSGIIDLGGRTFTLSGGTVNLITVLTGSGSLSLNNVILHLTPDLSDAGLTLDFLSVTVNGPGRFINEAGQTLSLRGGTINAPLVNDGELVIQGSATINGAITTSANSTLRLQGAAATGNVTLTVANGFTNQGTIELMDLDAPRAVTMNVSNGALVNAAGATIHVLAGKGGTRALAAELDNRGTLLVEQDLNINKGSANHTNSGTIKLSGADLTVQQPGISPSFTQSGIIDLGGHAFTFSGGTVNLITVLTGSGSLSLNNVILNLTPDLSDAGLTLDFLSVTVNGPGRFINEAGQTLSLRGGTINAPLVNDGELLIQGGATINGAITTSANSTLRLQGAAATGNVTLTVANGFTSQGTIELVDLDAARAVTMNVSNGVLVNAAGATIHVLAGKGGTRALAAELDNRGTLLVEQDLNINKGSANHTNSGTIKLSGADLTVQQPGVSPSFVNSGSIDLGSGQVLSITDGTVQNSAQGVLKGSGRLKVPPVGFTNEGTFAPGNSPGVITVSGNYPQTTSGVLTIELGGLTPGAEYDQLVVTNKATLDGTLNIALVNGFQPGLSNSFAIATFASRAGTFATVNYPKTDRYTWRTDYSATSVSVTVVNTAPTLDIIPDQVVDELKDLSVTAVGHETDPGQTITYELVGAPPAAKIDPNSGLISWATDERTGPGKFDFAVRVIDNAAPRLSSTNSFSVTVREVNTPPTLVVPTDQTINELTPLQVKASATDVDLPENTLTFSLVSPPDGMTIDSATGIISWTPNELQGPGKFPITVKVTDHGSADAVNPSLSDTKTFTVTVNEVNLAPGFTKGADQTVNEDSGPQAVPSWATGIISGPPGDAGAVVTFLVTNDNNSLFAAQPSVNSAGTLSYTPAPNANGKAIVTVIAKDDGGTANGGVDTSAPQTFTITVNPVNDPPDFTKGADQTINEDAGPQTVNAWATAIGTGPSDEAKQSLVFTAIADRPELFSIQPAINSAGTLTYTPAPNANGKATVTVTLKDSGGTANGGEDTSPPQAFIITVNAVNDAPTFRKGADQTMNEGVGARVVAGWATAISAGPADEAKQKLTFLVRSSDNAFFSVQPAIGSDGTLSFSPAANATGSVTVTVTLKDDGGTANGGIDTSADQTFIITAMPKGAGPIIRAIVVSEGKAALTWSAVAGSTYRVQYKDDLNAPAWKDLAGDVTATDTSASKDDNTIGTLPLRFYRVEALKT